MHTIFFSAAVSFVLLVIQRQLCCVSQLKSFRQQNNKLDNEQTWTQVTSTFKKKKEVLQIILSFDIK